ncbi:hypothetical protein VTO42DRAFT_8504 [Malbranchea cinnamomea]
MCSTGLDEFLSAFSLPTGFPGKQAGSKAIKDKKELFPNALDGQWERPPTSLRELTMMKVMDSITDKPNWNQKVFDEAIAAKWRAELLENDSLDISEEMFDFMDKELKYKAKVFEKTGAVVAYDTGVVKSDSVIPESLKLELRAAAAKLEDVPEKQKDWHPGSNNQVLDLVHPSLYPLVYSQSRVVAGPPISVDEALSRTGEGEVLPKIPEVGKEQRRRNREFNQASHYSKNFQWLPCEVALRRQQTQDEKTEDSRGSYRCEITSYINNLHPRDHRDLYAVIERIITRVVPLWNMTLSTLRCPQTLRISIGGPIYRKEDQTQPEQLDDEDSDAYWDRMEVWKNERPLLPPEPEIFGYILPEMKRFYGGGEIDDLEDKREKSYSVRLENDYNNLQVIVKLANIHLTPEKPKYSGGTWHVEGQLNERICATALYYYDSDNITESRLAFRQHVSEYAVEYDYEQDDHRWLKEYYGCENGDPLVQDVGSVECKEGRLLTFPNVFMHKVLPFELADKTRPGHRKILALFLVDPNLKILSTAHVPPQRRDWWERETKWSEQVLRRLPAELQLMVENNRDGAPFTEEVAKEIRVKLMDERKVFRRKVVDAWHEDTFSLCEH